jgi:hypothetical protein
MSVWRTLREQLLHPYHFQRVQALLPADAPLWNIFVDGCSVSISLHLILFTTCVLFTDEACFTQSGILNVHNAHTWADENPWQTRNMYHLHQFSVSVWAGIVGDHHLGPHVLPVHLTGNDYLQFLRKELPVMLEDVPLTVQQKMWFQHDGALAHQSSCQTILDWELSTKMDRAGRSCSMATTVTRPKSLGLFPLGEFEMSGVWNGSTLHTPYMSYGSGCMMLATQFAPSKEYLSECANLSGDKQKHVCRWLEITLNTYCKRLGTKMWKRLPNFMYNQRQLLGEGHTLANK